MSTVYMRKSIYSSVKGRWSNVGTLIGFRNNATVSTKIGNSTIKLESNVVSPLSDASIVATFGNTSIITSVAVSPKESEEPDSTPLQIEYRERAFAYGRIPSNAGRREGKSTNREILTSRVIDRTLRPLVDKTFRNDIQITSTLMSYDEDCDPMMLSILASSAALHISGVPLIFPAAGIRMGMLGDEFVPAPTLFEMNHSSMDMLLCGTRDSVVMIEAEAREVPDEAVILAMRAGHEFIQPLIDLQETLYKKTKTKKPKMTSTAFENIENVKLEIMEVILPLAEKLVEGSRKDRALRATLQNDLTVAANVILEKHYPDSNEINRQVVAESCVRDALRETIFSQAVTQSSVKRKSKNSVDTITALPGQAPIKLKNSLKLIDATHVRPDGRSTNEIRKLTSKVDFLPPPVHGSGLFSRGETQVLSVTTLAPVDQTTKLEESELYGLGSNQMTREELGVYLSGFNLSNADVLMQSSSVSGGTLLEHRDRMTELDSNVDNSDKIEGEESGHVTSKSTAGKDGLMSILRTTPLSDITSHSNPLIRSLHLQHLAATKGKRFYLHYEFPPFATGEIGKYALNRRSVGHGMLAEKAFRAVLPEEQLFPYCVRSLCETMGSDGSSSMASVCATTLSLLDAGVPLRAPVAGISVGSLIRPDPHTHRVPKGASYMLLSDILGLEDFLGDMDFKIAGTARGVTAIQLDIEPACMPLEVLEHAVYRSRRARCEILDHLNSTLPLDHVSMKPHAPKVEVLQVPPEWKQRLLGPGNVQKDRIARLSNTQLAFDGVTSELFIYGTDEAIESCKALIQTAVGELLFAVGSPLRETLQPLRLPEWAVGAVVPLVVGNVTEYGATVEFGGLEAGFLHVSEVAEQRGARMADFLQEGDAVVAQVVDVDIRGKGRFSVKSIARESGLPLGSFIKKAAFASASSPAGAGETLDEFNVSKSVTSILEEKFEQQADLVSRLFAERGSERRGRPTIGSTITVVVQKLHSDKLEVSLDQSFAAASDHSENAIVGSIKAVDCTFPLSSFRTVFGELQAGDRIAATILGSSTGSLRLGVPGTRARDVLPSRERSEEVFTQDLRLRLCRGNLASGLGVPSTWTNFCKENGLDTELLLKARSDVAASGAISSSVHALKTANRQRELLDDEENKSAREKKASFEKVVAQLRVDELDLAQGVIQAAQEKAASTNTMVSPLISNPSRSPSSGSLKKEETSFSPASSSSDFVSDVLSHNAMIKKAKNKGNKKSNNRKKEKEVEEDDE